MEERKLEKAKSLMESTSEGLKNLIDEMSPEDHEFFEHIRSLTEYENLNSMFERWRQLVDYE